MLNLSCNEDRCYISSSLQLYDLIYFLNVDKTPKRIYDQKICCFCFEDLQYTDLIELNCKHLFHLKCLICYLKNKYIEFFKKQTDKTVGRSRVVCIICNGKMPDIYVIFKIYKIFLLRRVVLEKQLRSLIV